MDQSAKQHYHKFVGSFDKIYENFPDTIDNCDVKTVINNMPSHVWTPIR